MDDKKDPAEVEQLLSAPGLADALESDRFKHFLDHVPVAIAVAELRPSETITYCNLEYERLTGQKAADVEGKDWTVLPGVAAVRGDDTALGEAVLSDDEYIGTFTIDHDGERFDVDAWSNTIESDEGVPVFRLVALARRSSGTGALRLRISRWTSTAHSTALTTLENSTSMPSPVNLTIRP
jgi:PAS domain S-box-containing protein